MQKNNRGLQRFSLRGNYRYLKPELIKNLNHPKLGILKTGDVFRLWISGTWKICEIKNFSQVEDYFSRDCEKVIVWDVTYDDQPNRESFPEIIAQNDEWLSSGQYYQLIKNS